MIGDPRDIGEKLAWSDEEALGFDSIKLDRVWNIAVFHPFVVDALITSLDMLREILAYETIEESAKDELLEIPAVNRASHLVGNCPDFAKKLISLLLASHVSIP